MAVRHRTDEQRSDAPRHASSASRRLASVLLGIVAVAALVASVALFFGGMTAWAVVAAVVCVAAGWGRSRVGMVGGRS